MLNGATPFGSREYVTLRFSKEDEEHLIPRNLVEKSRVISALIAKSHDSHIHIKDIASATFGDLIHFLSGDRQPLAAERIHQMIDAAQKLEMSDAVSQLNKILSLRNRDI